MTVNSDQTGGATASGKVMEGAGHDHFAAVFIDDGIEAARRQDQRQHPGQINMPYSSTRVCGTLKLRMSGISSGAGPDWYCCWPAQPGGAAITSIPLPYVITAQTRGGRGALTIDAHHLVAEMTIERWSAGQAVGADLAKLQVISRCDVNG